ncbi:MAG TPA: Gldg family protein [Dongiaceae bacterium]|nr:Gldg family protein [Dongiaceae bacterium]
MRVNKWFSGAGLILLALVVLFSTLFTDWLFKGVRFDLTEGKLYTLSAGSKKIVRNIPQPVELQFFFSQEATRDAQGWRAYAKQVRELLEEFALASNGKLKLKVIDPEPFSEQEDRAAAFGLQPIDAGPGGEKMFFGLVAQVPQPEADKPADDNGTVEVPNVRTEVIPVFQPDRQEMLEYDIAKLVYQVSQQHKPKVALLTELEVQGGFDMMMRQPSQPWATITQLEQLFDVKRLTGSEQEINPNEYQLLLLIHPKNLSDAMQFAIDQYVLRGGHALIFVDPFAEQEKGLTSTDRGSDLSKLFKAWGVEFDKTKFVGDAQLAVQVGGQGQEPVRHLAILQLSDKNLARDDRIVSKLETLHLSTAGFIAHAKDSKTTFEPLMESSEYAMAMEAEKLATMQDPRDLMNGFTPGGTPFVLAARVSGDVPSAFPDGVPQSEGTSKDAQGADQKTPDQKNAAADKAKAKPKADDEYLKASQQPINVVIVADTDLLTDRLWVQVHQFFGQQVVRPFADNGDFFFNSVDVLSGSADLIGIRGRGRYFRPFTVVQDMQRSAETSFQQVQESLNARLQDIEGKLAELQQKQGDDGNVITLTPEMQSDLQKFQQEKLDIRKQLREVQHQLNQDIDALDFRLKLINIAGVPLLLTVLAILLAVYRRKQMRRIA